MRKVQGLLVLVAGFFLLVGSATVCRAQDDDEAGGYVPARVNDANVVGAANFAVRERSKKTGSAIRLIEIKSAQQQVVAGLNFELCIEVGARSSGQEESVYFVTAVIYQNLQKAYSLTSWRQSDCGEE